jgi:hypothetical protein
MGPLLVTILIAALGGGRALADDQQSLQRAQTEQAAGPAPLAVEAWPLAGPSLRETGRVGSMPLAYLGARIVETPQGLPPREQAVQPATSGPGDAPIGSINTSILEHQLEEPVAALQDCRIEVARRQQRIWNEIAAGRVTLRWAILPTGAVDDVQVVALDPLDVRVLDCMKREMALWTFVPPDGGMVTVAQTFAFR